MSGQKVLTSSHASTFLTPLRKFFFDHGHVHVPNFPEYESLFNLCNQLRLTRAQLPHSTIKELDRMGFRWDLHLSNELRWFYHYEELKGFHKVFGHTRVPPKKEPYRALGTWVLRQRRDEKILSPINKRLLNKIDFEWSADIQDRKVQQWKTVFARLERFYKKNGHSNVPDHYGPDEKLGRWVSTVRYSEKKLEDWKRKLLRSVKFKFSEDIRKDKEAQRQKLFAKLNKFYKQYGHANVPETYVDSKLAISVAYLRQYPERIKPGEKKQLKAWNFLFSEDIKEKWERLWSASFKKLEKFKRENGHCRVSSAYHDQPLARWVANQRKDDQDGKLPAERKRKLKAIGFYFYDDIAAFQEGKWMKMYEKLIKYQAQHGDTIVKEGFRDSKLAYWVQHQRQARTRMSRKRKLLLNKIDFVWKVR